MTMGKLRAVLYFFLFYFRKDFVRVGLFLLRNVLLWKKTIQEPICVKITGRQMNCGQWK